MRPISELFRHRPLVARLQVALLAALVLGSSVGPLTSAEQVSLEGSWSGNGTVTFPSGGTEAARCRASFRRQSADRFAMNALCATPSGKVAQTAQLERVSGSRFSGEFQNSEYGIA